MLGTIFRQAGLVMAFMGIWRPYLQSSGTTRCVEADPVRRCLTKFGEVDDDEASGNTSVALTMYEEVSAVARGGVTQLNDSVVATEGKPSKIDYWNGSMARQGRAVNVSTLLASLSTRLCCHRKLRHVVKS